MMTLTPVRVRRRDISVIIEFDNLRLRLSVVLRIAAPERSVCWQAFSPLYRPNEQGHSEAVFSQQPSVISCVFEPIGEDMVGEPVDQ